MDIVDVKSLNITPNQCPIEREVSLEIGFVASAPILAGKWTLKYIVDSAKFRHVLELGSKEGSYQVGEHKFTFSVDKIDVTGVKRNLLLNVGLLAISLQDSDKDIVEINVVTQVSKDSSGNLIRTMFNPLE